MKNIITSKRSTFAHLLNDSNISFHKASQNSFTKESNTAHETQSIFTPSKKSSLAVSDKGKQFENLLQSDKKLDEQDTQNIKELKKRIQQLNHLFLNLQSLESDKSSSIVAEGNDIQDQIDFLRKQNTELKRSLINCSQCILQLSTQIQDLKNQLIGNSIQQTLRISEINKQEQNNSQSPIKSLMQTSTSLNFDLNKTQKTDFQKDYIEKIYKECKILQSQNSLLSKRNSQLEVEALKLKKQIQSKTRLNEYLTQQLVTLNKNAGVLQKIGSNITFACNSSHNSLLDFFQVKPK